MVIDGEHPDSPSLQRMVNTMVTRGTRNVTAPHVALALTRKGKQLSVNCHTDSKNATSLAMISTSLGFEAMITEITQRSAVLSMEDTPSVGMLRVFRPANK